MQEYAVTVIIVNFNTGHYLHDCVKSVLSSTIDVQVIVVDNDSKDNSIQLLQESEFATEVTILKNPKNLGFSCANNRAVRLATGNYLLFLNPDCIIKKDTIAQMQEAMEQRPTVGMAGCLITNSDGTIQTTAVRAIPTPWNSLVRVLHLYKIFSGKKFRGLDLANKTLPKKATYVEAISGAFMFVRRQALDDVGLLDENYFLYCEDIDWMMRFTQKNWKILFVPMIEIMHAKSISSRQRPFRVLWYKHNGMIRFYKKFFSRRYSFIVTFLVYFGICARFALLSLISITQVTLKRVRLSK